MSFSNDQKEQLSVNAVTTYIVRSEYMVPSIPVGDKAPSYDGHITLYKHQNSKKKRYGWEYSCASKRYDE